MNRYSASFGTLIKGKPLEPMTISMTVTDEAPLKLSKPTSDNAAFSLQFKTIEEGRRYDLIVSPPKIDEGLEKGTIMVLLGNPKLTKIELPLYARVAEAVEVAPKSVQLWSTPNSSSSTRIVTVSCHDRTVKDFSVGDVKIVGADSLTAKLRPAKSSRWAQIEIVIPNGFDSSTLEDKNAYIAIATNHPTHAELRVPVTTRTFSQKQPSTSQ